MHSVVTFLNRALGVQCSCIRNAEFWTLIDTEGVDGFSDSNAGLTLMHSFKYAASAIVTACSQGHVQQMLKKKSHAHTLL